jgi:hypothetical protein
MLGKLEEEDQEVDVAWGGILSEREKREACPPLDEETSHRHRNRKSEAGTCPVFWGSLHL